MIKSFFRDRKLLILAFIALAIKFLSLEKSWVERYYSTGIYPFLSKVMRLFFGWIPFSLGDLMYILAFIWLVWKTWRVVQGLKKKGAREYLTWELFRKYLKLGLFVYIIFSLFWGINYDRQGIEKQLGFQLAPYAVDDLFSLTITLQQRLNQCAGKIDSVERLQYNSNDVLFKKGVECYQNVQGQYPFLTYEYPSIKSSLFTPVGHWFGFTGYYNPFSAEAQLKTSIPVFLKPFVVNHEIAHQLGYAKENEASFVAYLTGKSSPDIYFVYSVYFEMYRDAVFQCRLTPNKEQTTVISQNIHPRVQADIIDLRNYLIRNKNFIEPLMTGVYDRYLKLNNQPKGRATYNEVIAYLVAYMKKFGKAAI